MKTDAIIGRSNLKNRWKWRFKRKHVYFLPWSLDATLDPLTIKSNSDRVLVSLHDDKLTINRHYHFDGATYAPDFDGVLMAAALHDALLQLADKFPFHVTYDMANDAFAAEMRAQRFKLRWIYSLAVRLYFAFK